MSIYLQSGDITDMQGPCPTGFHVPTKDEFDGLISIMSGLSITTGNNYSNYLHMPFVGNRSHVTTEVLNRGTYCYYFTSSYGSYSSQYRFSMYGSGTPETNLSSFTDAFPIRGFKDSYVTPDNTWTVITGTLGSGGIFWNVSDGIISITGDGIKGYTIADKNVGATTVYSNGDTLTDDNMGYMYQRGNNYGFPATGTISNTSTSQVDASAYGPGNYYNSSTFIIRTSSPYGWDSSKNTNLRGGETGPVSMSEVQNIYIGDGRIYKGEYIEYKMNADSSGNLYAPISGIGHNGGNYSNPYSWKISVDGGTATTYSGTGSEGGTIQLSGYTAGSNHTVKIVPTTESYGWALAFGFNQTSIKGYITEIVYDASYMGYAISATNTGDYVRYFQYRGCTLLTKPEEEYMPDTVTTIGNYFRSHQYSGCTGLIYSTEEALSDNVTTIGNGFRANQYNGCTSLTEIKGWKDLNIGNNYYRHQQYSGCTSNKIVKVLSNVGYNASAQNTLEDSYVTSVRVPSAYLTNFKNSSNYPWVGITDNKFIGY